MTPFEKLRAVPFLLESIEGSIVAEPMKFISTYKIYAKGRKYNPSITRLHSQKIGADA